MYLDLGASSARPTPSPSPPAPPAVQLAEAGNLEGAQQVLQVAEAALSSERAAPETTAMVTDLQNLASGYRSRVEYAATGSKSTRSIMQVGGTPHGVVQLVMAFHGFM